MRTMSMLALAVTLTATPAMAQGTQPHDMTQMMRGQGGMMMMGDGMMGMDADPTMILKLRESLALSADQVQRLTTMQEAAQSGMQQHMMGGMRAMQAAENLLAVASPDLKAYEASRRDAANHMVLMHTGMARVEVEARQVLTAQQRDHLTLARKMMKEMKDGMEKEGMMKDGSL